MSSKAQPRGGLLRPLKLCGQFMENSKTLFWMFGKIGSSPMSCLVRDCVEAVYLGYPSFRSFGCTIWRAQR